jgi:hypothetical protein
MRSQQVKPLYMRAPQDSHPCKYFAGNRQQTGPIFRVLVLRWYNSNTHRIEVIFVCSSLVILDIVYQR